MLSSASQRTPTHCLKDTQEVRGCLRAENRIPTHSVSRDVSLEQRGAAVNELRTCYWSRPLVLVPVSTIGLALRFVASWA